MAMTRTRTPIKRPRPKPEVDRELETIKLSVKDKSDLWIEFFQQNISLLLTENCGPGMPVAIMKDKVVIASELAEKALELIEERWGKVSQ